MPHDILDQAAEDVLIPIPMFIINDYTRQSIVGINVESIGPRIMVDGNGEEHITGSIIHMRSGREFESPLPVQELNMRFHGRTTMPEEQPPQRHEDHPTEQ